MFLFVPIKTDSPLRSTPWTNWALIAANLLLFYFERSGYGHLLSNWALNSMRPEAHQFVSYAFMHRDIWHVGGNMLFLYIFGNNVCDRMGNFAYLAFYLGGGIFAGIGYTLLNQSGLVVGASGAVAAVTGAYLALLPRARVTVFYWIFIMIGLREIPSLLLIAAFFVQDVFYSFSRTSDVANIAHVSGSVFGFAVGLLLLKTRLLPRDQFDMLALIERWKRRRDYQSVVRKGYDPFAYVPRSGGGSVAAPLSSVMERVQEARAQISEAMAHSELPRAADLYVQLRQIDPAQTLARASQVDIANQLYASKRYADAAGAYELFMKSYGNGEQAGQVALMLGLTYGRYLHDPAKAREHLLTAIRLLQFSREVEMAKAELLRLESPEPPPLPQNS